MTVLSNWAGVFIEDDEGRRVYVTKKDAEALVIEFDLDKKSSRMSTWAFVIGFALGTLLMASLNTIL